MKCIDIHNHFRQNGPWVDWSGDTVDRFIYGDPEQEITGTAVCWQSLMISLKEAVQNECNFVITHEPTFYNHRDNEPGMLGQEPGQSKKAFLDEHGITVYRCHDVWDLFPKVGIRDSWSSFLELGPPLKTLVYFNLHEIQPVSAWSLTGKIARLTASLGQPSVEFYGEKEKVVRSVCTGTGAAINFQKMIEMGADFIVATDDGHSYWRDGSLAKDLGIPYCTVNHATSEIPGMKNMVSYLDKQFADLKVSFVGPECLFETISNQ